MARMFVAAVPPDDVAEALDEFLAPRRAAAPFRWALPEQWHLTLAFMAQVPDRSLDDLVERLARTAARRRPMALRIGGGGAFPHADRAKVVYAEVSASPADLTELSRLATGARAAAGKAGAPVDGQRFRPHLTLGRLARPDNVTSWVRLLDAFESPPWRLDEIVLVASHLGQGPGNRPRHEIVETFPITGE